MAITLNVNGAQHVLDVPPTRRLLAVLRDDLALTGAKHGCGEGACGACAVLVDGKPVASCLLPVGAAEGRALTTIEGLSVEAAALQEAFVAEDALQCGFCTPGQVVSAAALLAIRRAADPGADPRRDGRQHLPLRHIPQDRAGDPPSVGPGGRVKPRLVKSQREMEGRFEDVWVLVDEDDEVETWPDDAELDVVGKPAVAAGRAAPNRAGRPGTRSTSRFRGCSTLSCSARRSRAAA